MHEGIVVRQWLNRLKALALSPSSYPKTKLSRIRTWAIAELVYSSGVAPAEIISLRPRDLDSRRPALFLLAREIPVTQAALEAIEAWTSVSTSYWGRNSAYLFSLVQQPDAPMTTEGLAIEFNDIGDQIGFRISARELRNALILELLRLGMPADQLAYITGMSAKKIAAM
ncbi:tyrosine-type recombinase/integrase [Pelagibacterium mangrovi]|uniref:tyrosine-type recombinase/integrase n=1 Tax=Pelagibacterium mangrovi TaxID=3119828 RepID=UPI002FCAAB85